MMESDLSGLRHKPLVQSQERTADKQVSKRSSDALMLSAIDVANVQNVLYNF